MTDSAWPGLGFNPAEGSVTTVEWLSHDVGKVADELEELHGLIQKIGNSDKVWKGEAATAFRSQLGKLPTYLHQGSKSMHDCSRALKQWRDRLHGHQELAKRLESDAITARSRVKETTDASTRINEKIDGINRNHVQLPQAEADKLTNESSTAASEAVKAVHDLDLIIARAERLQKEWERHSEAAAKAIREAAKNHPPDISVWERISGGLKKAWKGFKDFLVKHADLFSTLSSALALAAIVASVFPPAGAVLGGMSVACASAAAAGHYMAARRGLIDQKTMLAKMTVDGLGMIPGIGAGKGLATGLWKGARGVKWAVGSRASGRTMLNQIVNPMSTRWVFGPPVNRLAKRYGRAVSPEVITGTVKALSTVHGFEKLLTHGESSNRHADRDVAPAPAPVPYTGRRADGRRFHEALAA
ncbi:putative T7SS-secreted protein [Streptomyces sp. I05A-00742]|uniref:putative T7SS-secreted protein n=1 Tax=Streptomyces sp. I05A-00742 TaxID=2732853 RepID=UPI0014888487|nr:hypothetical protein [Streptomyces sp. I05A-00742]